MDTAARFFQDMIRSIAFGGLMFLSFVFLLGIPVFVASITGSSGPSGMESSNYNGPEIIVSFLLLGL